MGKPFSKELKSIDSVLNWSLTLDTNELTSFFDKKHKPSIIIGSGGSLSAAHLLVSLLRLRGKTSQVMTPLELFYSKENINSEQIFLISASGKNKDILFGLKTALYVEPTSIGCITMTASNPLIDEASKYSICIPISYQIPTGKDGFLATNTLIGTWAIILKSLNYNLSKILPINENNYEYINKNTFLTNNNKLRTIIVLYGKWGQPAAIDIESKCIESALSNVQLADYRNFGHGRHHWIDKHPDDTIVVALTSPSDQKLCEKTLSIIPSNINKLIISTTFEEPIAYLDLLIHSFYLIEALGNKANIDPGRPGVPKFGSRLYHVNPASQLNLPAIKREDVAVRRKLRSIMVDIQSSDELISTLKKSYKKFISNLEKTNFGIIVADYDGTLCESKRRFSGLSSRIANALLNHLSKGFILGIATGRGRSVQSELRKILPPELWTQVIIGYYNGSLIISLAEDIPDMSKAIEPDLLKLEAYIKTTIYNFLQIDVRTNQLSIATQSEAINLKLQNLLAAYVSQNKISDMTVLTSGSSIDVIMKGSKTFVVSTCQQLASQRMLESNCLCIGDQGNFPGNDFSLLSSPYSLSVDEVSTDPNTCWNLADLCQRNEQVFENYIDNISYSHKHFNILISK